MRIQVRALALHSVLRIWHFRELQCRLLTQLGSGVAVAVVWVGFYSSDSTPIPETSIMLQVQP